MDITSNIFFFVLVLLDESFLNNNFKKFKYLFSSDLFRSRITLPLLSLSVSKTLSSFRVDTVGFKRKAVNFRDFLNFRNFCISFFGVIMGLLPKRSISFCLFDHSRYKTSKLTFLKLKYPNWLARRERLIELYQVTLGVCWCMRKDYTLWLRLKRRM